MRASSARTSEADAAANILDVQGLVAGYGDATILRGVDVHLAAGEIVAIIGPNGAGKSTLIKAISGLIVPSGGRVVLNGRDVTGFPPQTIVGMGMSYVPQVRNTFPSLTVRENLELGVYLLNYGVSGYLGSASAGVKDGVNAGMLELGRYLLDYIPWGPFSSGVTAVACAFRDEFLTPPGSRYYSAKHVPSAEIRERMDRVLDLFPALRERLGVRTGTLSGGQQQMVALARALMLDPKVLLIDEPSAGLAPKVVDLIFARIAAINKAGTSILLVEQNAKKALQTAHRGYVLETGRNRFEDAADRLLSNPDIAKLYLGGKG